jgi:signal transduction histidine kinase
VLARTRRCASTVAIGIPDEFSSTFRFPTVVGHNAKRLRGAELPFDDSIEGIVLHAGESLRVDDARTFTGAHLPTVELLEAGAIVTVPLVVGDVPVAVLSASRTSGDEPFTAEDQELLEGLAALGAVALHTAQAFGRERARAEALSMLRQAEAEVEANRRTTRRVVEVQESERRRLAQDLHDRTAGALAGVQMTLRRLERESEAGPIREGLAAARADAAAAIEDLRDLIADLRPRVLDDFGLAPALERLGVATARRSGINVDVAADPSVNMIDAELASAAYRVVQEALTNAARHSHATHIRVSATVDADTLRVVIEDDGVGMPEDVPPTGYGVEGMRERAALAGGQLSIARPTGGGTRIAFEVPT